MKAIRFHQYGDADVLRLEDVELPEPAAGQVRVRVAGTSFNGVDATIRAGNDHLARTDDGAPADCRDGA